ncbi:MAG: hypothetical protein IJ849_11365 [Selenomonadaceae bacterium]|nr:hypothetical protein [Selenomonadaceae bacterium]
MNKKKKLAIAMALAAGWQWGSFLPEASAEVSKDGNTTTITETESGAVVGEVSSADVSAESTVTADDAFVNVNNATVGSSPHFF